MKEGCPHLAESYRFAEPKPKTPQGCEECLATGDQWVHLRLCLTCGHVGCCDDSKNKHATKHFRSVQHPVIRSFEPGETWRWCFADSAVADLPGVAVPVSAHP